MEKKKKLFYVEESFDEKVQTPYKVRVSKPSDFFSIGTVYKEEWSICTAERCGKYCPRRRSS